MQSSRARMQYGVIGIAFVIVASGCSSSGSTASAPNPASVAPSTSASTSASPTPSAPRIDGRFKVRNVLSKASDGSPIGKATHSTWTFAPTCDEGGCRTIRTAKVAGTTVVLSLVPDASGTYQGRILPSRPWHYDCYSLSSPGTVLQADGFRVLEVVVLHPKKVVDGHVQTFTGSIDQRLVPTAMGKKKDCHPSRYVYEVSGSALG